MNLASIIGWGVGFGAILISMAFTPTGLGVFWDLSSVFITIVGSFSALMASSEVIAVKKFQRIWDSSLEEILMPRFLL